MIFGKKHDISCDLSEDDAERKVSSLTVAELVKIIGVDDEKEKLNQLIKKYKEEIKAVQESHQVNKQLFSGFEKDVLQWTSPFKIESLESWDKFANPIRESFKESSSPVSVILIMGISKK